MPYNSGVHNIRNTPVLGAGTTAQRVVNVDGAMWANTDAPLAPILQRLEGGVWVDFSASAPTLPAWALAGNTLAGTNKLGAINNQPVIFYQNNIERMRLAVGGSFPLTITGASKQTGTPNWDNVTNSNTSQIVLNVANPYFRLFWSGFYDFYLRMSATGIELSTDVTGTILHALKVLTLTTQGGQIIMDNATGSCRLSMVSRNNAGDVSTIRMASNTVEKWIYGIVQGDNGLIFAFGNNTIPTATERVRYLDTGGIQLNGNAGLYEGNGSPEGVVTAALGSLYMNRAGGAGASLWVKETAPSGNTGWVAK